jgi:hypothetical protein
MAEATAAVWQGWVRPALRRDGPGAVAPIPFPPEPAGDDAVDVVVIGESSASGVPYQRCLSVGAVVAWELGRAIPARRFRLDVQAASGIELSEMYRRLARSKHRPDVLIVYAGHNEFSVHFPWAREVPLYYQDDVPDPGAALVRSLGRFSPVCRMIREAIDTQRVGLAPPSRVTRALVDVPAFTAAEYAERLDGFREHLEAIVASADRAGAVTVLVIPPANEAGYEPNRSVLAAATPRPRREAFARDFAAARRSEADAPDAAARAYRVLIDRDPGFAEAHFRLARLLERGGDRDGAYRHYVRARDLDRLPMRLESDFHEVYRDVAARHHCVLVDGPTLFHELAPDGLPGDALFNDAMHPSLAGHLALAQAVVDGLHGDAALGWPAGSTPPVIDPADCAAHFGLDRAAWGPVCELTSAIWRKLAYVRYDPSERLAKSRQFEDAFRQISAGRRPEDLSIPGVGLPPVTPRAPGGGTEPGGVPVRARFRIEGPARRFPRAPPAGTNRPQARLVASGHVPPTRTKESSGVREEQTALDRVEARGRPGRGPDRGMATIRDKLGHWCARKLGKGGSASGNLSMEPCG